MSYIINKFRGEQLIVLEDGTIDTSTSINLVGRNYVGYGEAQNENFLWMLENFANDNPPARPLVGQTWFNTTDNVIYVYDGIDWSPVGSAQISSTAPATPNAGELWLDKTADQLKIWLGSEWVTIGPEAVSGFGTTRARSTSLLDTAANPRPVIILEVDDIPLAICTSDDFEILPSSAVPGFTNPLLKGINLSNTVNLIGNLLGNAKSADYLSTPRLINGVAFDGQNNITISASTTNSLKRGTYILGSNFNGSADTTWSVDASSSNSIGKVVARDASGSFAAGTITASFVGDLSGNVISTGTSRFNIVEATSFVGATLSGNASSATRLETSRKINGVSFNGTSDITITASAATLTGNTLNPDVTQSSLTQVGSLVNLIVADAGITLGSSGQLRIFVDSGVPTIRSTNGNLNFDMGSSGPDISFVDAAKSLLLGGPNAPAILGGNTTNLGIVGYKFDKVYANEFKGNADTATSSTTSTNLAAGAAGSIPYQTAAGTTAMLSLGTSGYVLKAQASSIGWEPLSYEQLNKGSYVNMINTTTSGSVSYFNSSSPVTISVDAATTNTASKIVARDASGNFSAGTITASLTGDVNGNANTATRLQTARTINGVSFDGTSNITVAATDATKVALAGSTMTGYLTLVGNPTSALHAATKQYVDSYINAYTFTYGNTTYSISGYTNQVGSWNNGANYFDVFPPSGKSMGDLVAFIPSIAVIHYAGGVNGDDSMRCTWSNLGDRIRVYVQNTEQRSTPAANWLAIWS